MGRKRYIYEGELVGAAPPYIDGYLGGEAQFYRVEDVSPPEEEKGTIVRDDLRALAAIKDIYEYAKKKCDELDICHELPNGTPPAPEPLKPCPFCGGEGRLIDRFPELGWYQCRSCHVTGPCENSEAKARAAWNRRTP